MYSSLKRYIKRNKAKIIGLLILLPIFLTLCFYYTLYRAVKYIEARDQQIFTTGFEIGHFQGLTEGTDNAYDDFYAKLSPNPQVAYLFKKYFPDQEEARIMRAISLAESKGKQTAINKANKNGSIDSGFFQVNTIHKRKGETTEQFIHRMHNLEENFKEARNVYDKQSFKAWSTFNDGKYLSYIK